jgi:hypothetical protein
MLLSIVSILSGMQPLPTHDNDNGDDKCPGPIARRDEHEFIGFSPEFTHPFSSCGGRMLPDSTRRRVASIQQPVTTCFHVRPGNPDGRNPRGGDIE